MDKRIQFRSSRRVHLQSQLWLRVIAFFIDWNLIRLLLSPLFNIAPLESLIIQTLVFWFYCAWLESSSLQSTPGKWFFRFKVVDNELNRISFSKATYRFLLKVVSIVSVIGVMIIDVNSKHKSLHDLLVKTRVVTR